VEVPSGSVLAAGSDRQSEDAFYPIRSGNQRWFIASFDVPIGVTNQGARPGVISGLRLRLHFPGIPIPGNCEYVHPVFEINVADAKKISSERFHWIDKIVISEWMPFTMLPKQTATKHFVFESRWEEPVIQETAICTLEIRGDARTWQEAASWRLGFDGWVWSELADVGTSISYESAAGLTEEKIQCVPEDLHKYTGTKDAIPKGGFAAGSSHLDYPKDSTPKLSD
jgi:hypothetical protein